MPDNKKLQQLADKESRHNSRQRQPRRVASLMTWVQCFMTYAAVVAKAHPHRMRDLIAYLHMIVREAQQHGGDAWRSYNALFRKIAAPNSVIRWEQPLPSLYATSFLAARASAAASCENCRGDHKSKECTLSQHHSPKVGGLSKVHLTTHLGGHRRKVMVVLLVPVLQTAQLAKRSGISAQVDARATRHVRTGTLACAAASIVIK